MTGGWSDWQPIPDWFQLDLVMFMVDAPDGANAGYYRSGPLEPDGTVQTWRPWQAGSSNDPEARIARRQ